MTKHERLILPASLRDTTPTDVLDTEEKMRAAAEHLRKETVRELEELRLSKQAAIEEATQRFLD